MSDIGHKIDAWIASKPIESQRRIALSVFFLIAFVMGSLMALVALILFNLVFASQNPITWWWVPGYGFVMGLIVVWNLRDPVPDGGYKANGGSV